MRPSLAFTGGSLDRAAHRRRDDAWLGAHLAVGAAGIVPVWRDLTLVIEADGVHPVVVNGGAAAPILAAAETVAFLGVDAAGHAIFAADLPAAADALAMCSDGAPGAVFQDLGALAPRLTSEDGALLAYARALMRWHRRHRFCGDCGAPMTAADGGHLRRCSRADCGEQRFPHTDPVVIMLVADGERCLLARQPKWIDGLYSTLAGFVEPGESLEEAVAREIREESGISVAEVRYVASQPWPFPQSLMLGFHATAPADAELVFDATELEDARWFSRADFADLRRRGIRLPYRGTIARALIEDWLADPGSLADPPRRSERERQP